MSETRPEPAWAALLRDAAPRSFLDVACGQGDFAAEFLQYLPKCTQLFGIDTHSKALDAARQREWPCQHEWHEESAARMPFLSGMMHLVAIRHSLHHMEDARAVLGEMNRVLGSRGLLLVQEMICDGLNPAQQNHMRLHHWWADIDQLNGVCHRHTYTRRELDELLDLSGFNCLYEEMHEDQQSDPFDPELQEFLEARITESLIRLPDSTRGKDLLRQANELREYLQKDGFQGASNKIVVLGKTSQADRQA